jgi:hypothetical protein
MQSFDNENQTTENTQPAPNPGCGFFQGGDVWFIAVVPASGAMRIERPKGTLNTQYTLYSGTYGNMEVRYSKNCPSTRFGRTGGLHKGSEIQLLHRWHLRFLSLET